MTLASALNYGAMGLGALALLFSLSLINKSGDKVTASRARLINTFMILGVAIFTLGICAEAARRYFDHVRTELFLLQRYQDCIGKHTAVLQQKVSSEKSDLDRHVEGMRFEAEAMAFRCVSDQCRAARAKDVSDQLALARAKSDAIAKSIIQHVEASGMCRANTQP